jgi:acetoin utilization deacetylase AcuC-like enzyme
MRGAATVRQWCSFAAIAALGAGILMSSPKSPKQEASQSPRLSDQSPARRTGFVFSNVYLRHLSGETGHPERPERLLAIRSALERAGLFRTLISIDPRRVTDDELKLVHTPSYVALARRELSNIQELTQQGLTQQGLTRQGLVELSTGDTLASAGTLEAAEFAVGGVLNAVDAVMAGRVANAFVASRPPGHHATPDRGMGFCVFNGVAIAARYLQKVHGVRRVLIVDWDYHHGNGTQDAFYNDDGVFYFSTHHYGAYPGTGSPQETGSGRGQGTNLNVPLPVSASDAQILAAFEDKLVPAARAFRPDFILISAGFDAMRNDLLGRFDVTPEGFAAITRVTLRLADEFSQGRVVSVLEGGYRLDGLGESVLAHLRVLQGS